MAWWIFQNVLVTAALVLVVAAICRTTRMGPVARHALWVLVLVKFITPPIVVWPWELPDPLGLSTLGSPLETAARPLAEATAWPSNAVSPAEPDAGSLDAAIAPAAAVRDDALRQSVSRAAIASWPWLLAVWALGSLAWLGLQAIRTCRIARRVRHAGLADPAIRARVAVLSDRLGISPIPVVTIAGSGSPFVWSLGPPRLVWPAEIAATASDACVDGLILHELAHVKRRDHLVGWIELAAGVVWWWNPLFWWVRSSLREQAELACDAWVISTLPAGRRAYAESLLALSCASGFSSTSVAVMGVRPSSRRVLERRLVMIMNGRAALRLPWAGLLTLGLLAGATLPAWASMQQPPPPPPAPARPVVRQTPPAPPAPAPAPTRATPPAPPVPVVTLERQAAPKTPPPPPAPRQVTVREAVGRLYTVTLKSAPLTADGEQLVKAFEADRDAIEREADQKVATRREALVKALTELQDQYTKAGKLDEAVMIRDYLRSSPNGLPRFAIRKR